jgi:hypothetical protein
MRMHYRDWWSTIAYSPGKVRTLVDDVSVPIHTKLEEVRDKLRQARIT